MSRNCDRFRFFTVESKQRKPNVMVSRATRMTGFSMWNLLQVWLWWTVTGYQNSNVFSLFPRPSIHPANNIDPFVLACSSTYACESRFQSIFYSDQETLELITCGGVNAYLTHIPCRQMYWGLVLCYISQRMLYLEDYLHSSCISVAFFSSSKYNSILYGVSSCGKIPCACESELKPHTPILSQPLIIINVHFTCLWCTLSWKK